MTSKFRTRFFGLCISLAFTTFTAMADNGSVRPENLNLKAYIKTSAQVLNNSVSTVKTFETNILSKKTNTVCVCEIMELRNNNVQISKVAVFAEKTNNGELGNDYKIAERVIRKERKQMKDVYFDEIKTDNKMAVPTSCMNLYLKLKKGTPELKLYDILNVNSK